MVSNESLESPYPNINAERLEKLKGIFPEAFTEGEFDIEKLRSLLGENVSTGSERYSFTWAGKQDALQEIRKPAWGTLVPSKEESINFEDTENLYIEGENLEVLKLLYKTYHGRVKMIYIDPPYNKDKDFVYSDRWSDSKEAYLQLTGQKDKEGNLTSTNTETAGRRHSNWLSMMYPRLFLARQLLREDGVIFISIDDTEVANLRKLCDEVFGEENFVTQLVWEKKKKGTFLSDTITNMKEYLLVYAKSKVVFNGLIGEINSSTETYPCVNATNRRDIRIIPKGIISKYKEKNYHLPKGSEISASTMTLVLHNDLIIKDSILAEDLIIEGNWRYNQETMTSYAVKHELYITQDLYLRRIVFEPRNKTLKDLLLRKGTSTESVKKVKNLNNLFVDGWGSNEDGEEELRILLGVKEVMDYPKPIKLLEKLTASVRDTKSIILDFFAGSSTTAHAVMQLNAEDGGNRKYIMVQLPERIDDTKERLRDNKAAIEFCDSLGVPRNISEIGKERIRRASSEIKEEQRKDLTNQNTNLDLGFRVFKLQPSHIRKWQPLPPDTTTEVYLNQLEAMNTPLLDDWNLEEVIYEIILSEGLSLTSNIEQVDCESQGVFKVTDNEKEQHIYICLDSTIVFDNIKPLRLDEEDRFICRDSALDDTTIANLALTCRVKTISEL